MTLRTNIFRTLILLLSIVLASTAAAQVTTGGVAAFGNLGLGESTASSAPVRQVAAGYNFIAALRSDGTVVCWGDNSYGQCNVPARLSGIVQIACGLGHVVALRSNGTVICWGNNKELECQVPSGLSGVVQIAAGFAHTVALKADGTLACWGSDRSYQISRAKGLTGVLQVAASGDHTAILFADGTVGSAGDNTYYEGETPPDLTTVIQVTAGQVSTAALQSDLKIEGWGDGVDPIKPTLTDVIQIAGPTALLSNGTVVNYISTAPTVPTGLTGVVQIDASLSNTVALKSNGSVVVWGDNMDGQCNVPQGIVNAIGASSSFEHTAILRADHTVVCRGLNRFGECNVPAGLTGVIQVSAGESILDFINGLTAHTVALKSNGTVVCWGDNQAGQSTVPPGLTGVTQVSAGGHHTAVRKSNGTVVCWGDNSYGQSAVPAGLAGVSQVSAGGFHTLALKSNGTVVGWGDNSKGQCNVPAGLTDVIQVAAGEFHSVALKKDGTLVGWGNNLDGELSFPSGLTGVVQVAAGCYHTAVRKSNGAVFAWGVGYLQPNVPIQGQDLVPAGLVAAADVEAGHSQTNAIPVINLTMTSWIVPAGSSANATIFLPVAPGAQGADVAISSDDPSVTVPSTVHLNQGVQTAVFPVSVAPAAANAPVKVIANFKGQLSTTVFRVISASPPSNVLGPASIVGGQATMMKMTLASPLTAPTTFTIKSGSTNARAARSTWLLPTGTDSFTFEILTRAVGVQTPVLISVLHGTTPLASASLTLIPPLKILPSDTTVVGGNPLNVTIQLPAPVHAGSSVTVALASNVSAAIPPKTVQVTGPASAVTFAVATKGVSLATPVSLTAAIGSDPPVPSQFEIDPANVATITATPNVVVGDNMVNLTVTLNGESGPFGSQIRLSGSNPAGRIPSSFLIGAGATSGVLPIQPVAVTSPTVVTVQASVAGPAASTTFTINPTPNHLTGFTLSPSSPQPGQPVTLTATFSGPSAPTGLTLILTSSDSHANVPRLLTSAAAATSLTYTFTPGFVDAPVTITVSAAGGGTTIPATLNLKPTELSELDCLEPSGFAATTFPIKGGNPISLAAIATGLAGPSGLTIGLTSSDPALIAVPTTMSIQSGQAINVIQVSTLAVTASRTVTLTATHGAVVKNVTVILSPTDPNPATLQGILMNSASVQGGTSTMGFAFAYAASASGFTITLTSSDPSVLTVPSTLLVGKSPSAVTPFNVTTKAVTSNKTITITAKQGSITKTTTLLVTP